MDSPQKKKMSTKNLRIQMVLEHIICRLNFPATQLLVNCDLRGMPLCCFTDKKAKPQKDCLSLCHHQTLHPFLLFITFPYTLGHRIMYLMTCVPAGNGTNGGCAAQLLM